MSISAREFDEMFDVTERRDPPLPLVWQCYPTTFLLFEGDRPPADDYDATDEEPRSMTTVPSMREDKWRLTPSPVETAELEADLAPPECPFCGETDGLRMVHDGGGYEPPEYTCEQCFKAMDDGPGFDDLEPAS